jgi:hypothetical protein
VSIQMKDKEAMIDNYLKEAFFKKINSRLPMM